MLHVQRHRRHCQILHCSGKLKSPMDADHDGNVDDGNRYSSLLMSKLPITAKGAKKNNEVKLIFFWKFWSVPSQLIWPFFRSIFCVCDLCCANVSHQLDSPNEDFLCYTICFSKKKKKEFALVAGYEQQYVSSNKFGNLEFFCFDLGKLLSSFSCFCVERL